MTRVVSRYVGRRASMRVGLELGHAQVSREPGKRMGGGESTMRKASRPLAGIRVVDLTRVLAGPFCSMMLGDMGAEVIKVEEPGRGDDTRSWPPFLGGEATYFLSVNRNKKSLTVNLKAPDGQAIVRKLAAKSDVVLENFRPGTMDRLGLGYPTLAKINRRLVYCAISGFGESGPEASRPGYDLVIQGESGLMDLTGFPDSPPVKFGTSIADLMAGAMGAHAVALALLARVRTRRGQKVEVAMLDVMAALLTYHAGIYFATKAVPTRRGNAHPSIAPYEVFRAADAYLTIGVANNSLWERFCAALERPELTRDSAFDTEAKRVEHRERLIPLLNEIFAAKPAADWLARLDKAGVPAGRIKTVDEVCESAHLQARDMIVDLPHPTAGTVRTLGVPIRLHGTPGAAETAPPTLGQHTEQVLTRILGYRRADVARLRQAGVV
jgi:crotonobetainyl-CoA:carnitine CoA-transferase CaiB-like acyl-CoA transferase